MKYVKHLAVLFLQLALISPLIAGENPFLNPQYRSSVYTNGQLRITTNEGLLTLTPFGSEMVRVALTENGELQPSYAVIAHLDTTGVTVKEDKNSVTMNLSSLQVSVLKNPLQIAFIHKGTTDTIAVQKATFSRQDTTGFRFRLQPREMIFGGGERAISMNRVGHRLHLNNEAHYGYGWGEENLNFSVPYFVSSNEYGILFDNPSIGYADLGKKDANTMELGATGGQLVYYFLAGKTFENLHHSLVHLTGTQPMPPRWALGNLQSRFGYQTEQQARNMVDSMQMAGYPLDGIILDLYWFGQGEKDWRMGDLDWFKQNWPTPKKMIADFKKKGVHTILITEPYILQSSNNFPEADSLGILADDETGKTGIISKFYFGKAGLIDMFDPVAQDWFWKKYNKQIKIGVSGWWGDLGEPETLPSNLVFINGKANDVKNAYGLVWSKMLHDKYAANYPDVRLFHLNRAGFAGSQRYSSFPWSGDVGHSWAGFKAQIPIMLGMTMCQIPYASSDLGGFSIGKKDEELYRRWLQFGVFNPIFRPHSGTAPPEPIHYSDSTQTIVRKFIKLRYRLMPYNYTLTWQQSVTGEPLASPVFYKSAYPKKYWSNNDLYYWGNAFLVSPVLEPGEKSKDILLPRGTWFDYFTGEEYDGNGWVHYNLNDSTIPVFVKAGSFIPSVPDFYSTSQYSSQRLTVDYYYSPEVKQAEYTMYEDDGHTRDAYKKGEYELLHFAQKSNKEGMQFRFTRDGGHYSGAPENREMKLVVHRAGVIHTVQVDNVQIPVNENKEQAEYSAELKNDTLVIHFPWKMSDAVTIQLN